MNRQISEELQGQTNLTEQQNYKSLHKLRQQKAHTCFPRWQTITTRSNDEQWQDNNHIKNG